MAWDWWNNLTGGASKVLDERLKELGDKPYVATARTKLAELSESGDGFDVETEGKEFTDTFMNSLRDYMRTLPADQRYGELKTAVQALDVNGTYTPMLAKFDGASNIVKEALGNAVMANPEFLDYIGTGGNNASLGGLLSDDVLNNPQYAGPLADILNTIANNPGTLNPETGKYEGGYPLDKLDALGVAANAFFTEDAKRGDERNIELIRQRQRELLDAVRDAGGNVPVMMNMNGEMLMKFISDLFNGNIDGAISNLAGGLGLSGADLADFKDLVQPFAGILKFMGQDAHDYAQEYGPQFAAYGAKTYGTISKFMSGERVTFQAEATGDEPHREVANAETGITGDYNAGVTVGAGEPPAADNENDVETPGATVRTGTYGPSGP